MKKLLEGNMDEAIVRYLATAKSPKLYPNIALHPPPSGQNRLVWPMFRSCPAPHTHRDHWWVWAVLGQGSHCEIMGSLTHFYPPQIQSGDQGCSRTLLWIWPGARRCPDIPDTKIDGAEYLEFYRVLHSSFQSLTGCEVKVIHVLIPDITESLLGFKIQGFKT